MNLIAEFPDVISAVTKVFEVSKWSLHVNQQTLDIIVYMKCIEMLEHANLIWTADCVTFRIWLEYGIFHKDTGYCSTRALTSDLSILDVKIGSAVNALKRVLLSFGEEIDIELRRRRPFKQGNDQHTVTQTVARYTLKEENI
ncbi:uncharacterized protein LOC112467397 [Temnothorax curvispinosus]|uniref:Uncharacterized protein LOC112467397 n=1 Tax=Temnothorax curvispinosus TaxID=300111 RepID=A0A6J1R9Q2_9HYME|nr:uncharacterized protein LOC112467397 [Temnothorax curvispinosus]